MMMMMINSLFCADVPLSNYSLTHSSRACKNPAACVKCGKAGHEGANCSNQEQCANCKGKHAASSRECPKWKLEKQVQQIKVERGISFPDARKVALSEESTNTSSKRTRLLSFPAQPRWHLNAAKNKRCLSLYKPNWLGHREPVPLCQSKQIARRVQKTQKYHLSFSSTKK